MAYSSTGVPINAGFGHTLLVSADGVPTCNSNPLPVLATGAGFDSVRDVLKTLGPEWNYTQVYLTGNTVIKNSAGAYGGYRFVSANATTAAATMAFIDSLTSAGQLLDGSVAVTTTLTTNAVQAYGIHFLTGLTVNLTTALTSGCAYVAWK